MPSKFRIFSFRKSHILVARTQFSVPIKKMLSLKTSDLYSFISRNAEMKITLDNIHLLDQLYLGQI